EKIAVNKGNRFYINNQYIFELKTVRKWLFGKEKYQLIDTFGKVQLFFYIKPNFRYSKIVFVENNLLNSYKFIQNKNNFYWIANGHKYYIKQTFSFSYRIEFYKDNKL